MEDSSRNFFTSLRVQLSDAMLFMGKSFTSFLMAFYHSRLLLQNLASVAKIDLLSFGKYFFATLDWLTVSAQQQYGSHSREEEL